MNTATLEASTQEPVMMESMDKKKTIQSRFGEIEVDYSNALFFEHGLYGIENKHRFCIVPFPIKKFSQFRLMQCLDDDELSFIVLPVDQNETMIAPEDIANAAADLGINPASLSQYLVVSVIREDNLISFTVNLRAPLLINASQATGVQHVLTTGNYEVRQPLQGKLAKPH